VNLHKLDDELITNNNNNNNPSQTYNRYVTKDGLDGTHFFTVLQPFCMTKAGGNANGLLSMDTVDNFFEQSVIHLLSSVLMKFPFKDSFLSEASWNSSTGTEVRRLKSSTTSIVMEQPRDTKVRESFKDHTKSFLPCNASPPKMQGGKIVSALLTANTFFPLAWATMDLPKKSELFLHKND
jgi:hypothetical protein